MKEFELKLSFDGTTLHIDYCDGSDVESVRVPNQTELEAVILEHVRTALSEGPRLNEYAAPVPHGGPAGREQPRAALRKRKIRGRRGTEQPR